MSVTVIVPVWNQVALLCRLMATLEAQTQKAERILLVDNGSTEDVAAVAARAGADLISMGRNAGFAAAVNRGIAAARTEWVALINSDVELAPDWLEGMLQSAQRAGADYAAGKLLMDSDARRIDGTWDLLAVSGCAVRAGHGHTDGPLFDRERAAALVPATAAIYRRALFAEVGDFAEIYGSYLEDVDFCVRAACAGARGLYVPQAVARHHGQGSSGRWSANVVERNARNQVLLVKRLYPGRVRRRFRWKIFVGQMLWGAVAVRRGQMWAWLRGRAAGRRLPCAAVPLGEAALQKLLMAGEREIRELQSSAPDPYWRLYFLATGRESE